MNANPAPQPTPNPPSDFQWKIDEATGGVIITTFLNQTATEVVIPNEIDGRPVTKIGASAFSHCDSLASVVFPNGLKTIGHHAFYNCYSLTSVALPSELKTIGDWAFYNCGSLASVALPDGLETIGKRAFSHCDSLTEFTVSSANKHFRAVDGVLFTADGKTLVAYPAGNKRTEYVVPDGVETIGDEAFYRCASLTSVALPNGLQTIGDWAFYNCGSLTSVALPDGLETIGDYAFSECESLSSVVFPDGLQTIGDEAFYRCGSLTSVALPNGLETIGDSAFSGCKALPEFTVSSANKHFRAVGGVLFTADGKTLVAYPAGNKRTEYVVPDGVETIDYGAFSGCGSLASVALPDGLQTIGDYAFSWCGSLTSVAFPNGLQTIGDYAFYECDSLTSVALPSGLETIGEDAFLSCNPDLTICCFKNTIAQKYAEDNRLNFANFVAKRPSINDDKTPPNSLNADDGVLYSRAAYEVADVFANFLGAEEALKRYPTERRGELVIINDAEILERYPHLEKLVERADHVVERENLTQIADFAFYNCEGLTKVTLIGKFDRIGSFAFVNCSSLKEFSVYGAISEIADWPPGAYSDVDAYGVFDGCDNLSKLEIYATTSDLYIGNSAFHACNALTNVTIHAQSITFGARYDYWDVARIDEGLANAMEYGYGAFESGLSRAVVQLVGHCQFGNSSFADADLQVLNIHGSAWLDKLYQEVDFSVPGQGCGGCMLNDGMTPFMNSSLEIFNVTSGVHIASLYCNAEDLSFHCRLRAFSAASLSASVDYFYISRSNGLTMFKVAELEGKYKGRLPSLKASDAFNNLTFYTPPNSDLAELAKQAGASVQPFNAADVVSNDGRFAIVPLENGVEIVRFLDFTASTLEVPDEIGGRPVTKIGDYAFYKCESLTSVALPDGLQTVGDNAFSGCDSDLTLYGAAGSVAEKYAKESGLRFEAR